MRRRSSSIVLGVMAALGLAATSRAQPDADFIRRWSMPVEGAPLAEPGAYEVVSGAAFDSPRHVVVRPAEVEAFPVRDSMPVLVWGNGGCALSSDQYLGFLSTIASHGFVVLATAGVNGDDFQRFATIDDLRTALDWAEKENAREGSPLHGKIATDRMAAMGTSCGGALALTLGSDPRIDTTGIFNTGSGPLGVGEPAPSLADFRGPVLVLNGHERDPVMASSARVFDEIEHVPVFYGARHNGGHLATYLHPGGGEFANVVSSWLRFVLKGDAEAAKTFVGDNCGLCSNENWDTKAKGLE